MPQDYKNINTQAQSPFMAIRPSRGLAFLTGLILGLFVAVLVYFKTHQAAIDSYHYEVYLPAPVNNNSPENESHNKAALALLEPEFDFYKILPNKKLDIEQLETLESDDVADAQQEPTSQQKPAVVDDVADAQQEPTSQQKPAAVDDVAHAQQEPTSQQKPATVDDVADAQQEPTSQQKPATVEKQFVLQVGSFKKLTEANKLTAQLKSIGITATIQEFAITKDDIRHRVRVGPYQDQDLLQQTKARLSENNLEYTLLELKL